MTHDTMEFKHRNWQEITDDIKTLHSTYARVDLETTDLTADCYTWEYYGKQKYTRYAACNVTKTQRQLTLPEFYGMSAVD